MMPELARLERPLDNGARCGRQRVDLGGHVIDRARRWSTHLFGGLAALCGLVLIACSADPPPHVLLLTIDTLRPDYMSRYGYDRETTPYLDSLFAQGHVFDQAISPMARTTPALASLLTGAYPHTTGVRSLHGELADDVVPITEVLKAAGYQTMAVVTNQMLRRERRLDRGFDYYDMGHPRTARQTSDKALGRLAWLDFERPIFAWVHYFDPHVPYHPDTAIAREFSPGYEGPYAESFGQHPRGPGTWRAFPVNLPKPIAVHRNPLAPRVNEHIRRLYAADIRGLDAEIERFVKTIREALGDNLIIVVTADHGESLGEHDFYYDHGDYVYQAGIRVPLAVIAPSEPSLHGSEVCEGWVSLVDVAPTLVELLGLGATALPSEQLEGRSLVPCLRGESLPDVPVFSESGHSHFPDYVKRRKRNDVEGRFRAVVLGDWKLIWTPFEPEDRAFELYHLRDDPHETRNRVEAGQPVVVTLRAHLDSWLARARPDAPEPSPGSEDLEALRALGYIE